MIRRIRVSDAPRHVFFGRLSQQDLAITRPNLAKDEHGLSAASVLRWGFSSPHPRYAITCVDGAGLDAVVVAHPRTGMRSWEVAHFFTSDTGLAKAADLLEACAVDSAAQGAERLFLRTPAASNLEKSAMRAGFVPAYTEELYRFSGPLRATAGGAQLRLRPATFGDDHLLFRLYNSAVPAPVRSASGLTLDQWRDSGESLDGRARAYIWEPDGEVLGWLRLVHDRDVLTVEASVHPDGASSTPSMLGDAARLAWGHHTAMWLVPSYQPVLALALRLAGWQTSATYSVLVCPLAKPVEEPSLVPARA